MRNTLGIEVDDDVSGEARHGDPSHDVGNAVVGEVPRGHRGGVLARAVCGAVSEGGGGAALAPAERVAGQQLGLDNEPSERSGLRIGRLSGFFRPSLKRPA